MRLKWHRIICTYCVGQHERGYSICCLMVGKLDDWVSAWLISYFWCADLLVKSVGLG